MNGLAQLPTPAQRAAITALVCRARAVGQTDEQLVELLERFTAAARLPDATVRAAARQAPCYERHF